MQTSQEMDNFYEGQEFKNFFRNSSESLIIKANDPLFTILAVSQKFLDISLKKYEEVAGKNLFEIFPDTISGNSGPLSATAVMKEVIQFKEQRIIKQFIYDSPQASSHPPLYWRSINSPVLDETGEVAYIINETINITDQVLLEQKEAAVRKDLDLQQQRFNSIFMNAPVGLAFLSNENYKIEYVNAAMTAMWGRKDPEQITGRSIVELFPGIELSWLRAVADDVLSTGKPFRKQEARIRFEKYGKPDDFFFNLNFEAVINQEEKITGMVIMATEITEEVHAKKAIELAEERLRLASEASGIGTYDLDLLTNEIIYSPVLAKMFGFDHQPITHDQFRNKVFMEDIPRLNEAFEVALKSGIYFYEARIHFSETEVKYIKTFGKVLFDKNKKPFRMLGAILDQTDVKMEEIRKNDFIAMASHELKTPLTSLKGYTHIIKSVVKKGDEVLALNLLNKTERQVNKMHKLIHNFLDLTKLESSKIELSLSSFDINELIREVINDHNLPGSRDRIFFKSAILPEITADRNRIEQVLDNLINNALKYSDSNSPVYVESLLGDDLIKVTISDEGVGIDKSDHKKIFQRFYRVDRSRKSNTSGFGIGLYLSAQVVELHRGYIGVEDKDQKGSIFYFTLPIKRSEKV